MKKLLSASHCGQLVEPKWTNHYWLSQLIIWWVRLRSVGWVENTATHTISALTLLCWKWKLGWAWQKDLQKLSACYTKQVWQLKILSVHLLNPILPFFLLNCPFNRTQQLDIYIWHSNHNSRKINVPFASGEAGVRLYICSG